MVPVADAYSSVGVSSDETGEKRCSLSLKIFIETSVIEIKNSLIIILPSNEIISS